MKTKLLPYIIIALVYAFPFRYAYFEPTDSNIFNLMCMLLTAIGTLIFIILANSDTKEQTSLDHEFIQEKPANK